MIRLHVVGSGSKGNCYLLEDDDHYLALDAGCPWLDVEKACSFQVSKIDGCLITHRHSDHSNYAKCFFKEGIQPYSNDDTHSFILDTQGEYVKALAKNSILRIYNRWTVVPWEVPHSNGNGELVPCYAYFIKTPREHRMAYITDFLYSPVAFSNLKVQTILVACNHDDEVTEEENGEGKYRHIVTGHSSLSIVKDLVLANQTDELRNVILCHLSESNASPDKMQSVIQEAVGNKVTVTIARKGKTINLTQREVNQ